MTATYSLDTAVGKVRLVISDTDVTPATDAVFTDEELTYFLTANSNSINLASADALDAWAAKYGQNASTEGIGDYNYSQTIIMRMMQLSKRLRDIVSTTPAMAWSEMNLTGIEENE